MPVQLHRLLVSRLAASICRQSVAQRTGKSQSCSRVRIRLDAYALLTRPRAGGKFLCRAGRPGVVARSAPLSLPHCCLLLSLSPRHADTARTMFGRLTQIAINLVAISTILGGVKRATGYS